jgi:tetratricopeptide (TPR) repeat protein
MRYFFLFCILFSICFAEYSPLQDNLELKRYDQLYALAKQEVFTSENAYSYYYLGQAYAGLGRKVLAEAAFAQVFQYAYDENYGLAIAQYYEDLKNEQKASEIYARVLKDFPTQNVAAQRLGELYFKQEKYQDTIDVCTRLVEEYPDQANPLAYYIGTSYFILGNFPKALEYLELAQTKGYVSADLTIRLGYMKIKAGDTKIGVELLAKGIAASQKPQPTYFYTTLGEAYARLSQFDLAASAYRKAIASGRQPVQVYINFASNAVQAKNFQAIIDVLEPSIDRFSKNGEYLYYLASACDNLGVKDQAATYYQKALDANYQNKAFVKGRISALSRNGTESPEEE